MTKALNHVGFTLAEVLITLGIIGIVAAMTMPTLLANYRKHTVEVKLKKFYTNMNQAIKRSEIDHGETQYWELPQETDAQNITENNPITSGADKLAWFNEYIGQYMIITEENDNVNLPFQEHGYANNLIYFPDGSALSIGWKCQDYFFLTNPKQKKYQVGKNVFLFAFNPKNSQRHNSLYYGFEPYIGKITFTGNINALYGDSVNYTKIIQMNGWKIPKNYPIGF